MLYHFYEWNHAALAPFRAVADATRLFYQNPLNPLSHTSAGRSVAAMAELFERTTRIYGKPEFSLFETFVDGQRIPVQDRTVWEKPFCRLLHFDRELPKSHKADPRFLVVAPMSGHYATLLRGTVEALLPYADVYITDWTDARQVPLSDGSFDLDDYTDYVVEMLRFLGPDTHVIGVCQPAVPVLMAVAAMEAEEDPCAPATMTLMGGPIDTRINPTAVNQLAEEKGIDWFRDHVIMKVPFPQAGFMRDVYPGFLQLSGFMSMNLDRHMIAHKDFFWHLVKNDGDSAEKHREFYDEYLAVMDMTAEFYLQTVEEVFIKHSLPKGEMMHRGKRIDLTKIRRTALLTVEGENDDISGVGQTEAAQRLCCNIPDDKRVHYVQPKVGHYGVFNGSRFRAEIAPRIVDFALTHGTSHAGAQTPKPAAKASGGLQREGAVKEREAKADVLGKDMAAAGETVLTGIATPTPASVMKAISAPAVAVSTPADAGGTTADEESFGTRQRAVAPKTEPTQARVAKPDTRPETRTAKPAEAPTAQKLENRPEAEAAKAQTAEPAAGGAEPVKAAQPAAAPKVPAQEATATVPAASDLAATASPLAETKASGAPASEAVPPAAAQTATPAKEASAPVPQPSGKGLSEAMTKAAAATPKLPQGARKPAKPARAARGRKR